MKSYCFWSLIISWLFVSGCQSRYGTELNRNSFLQEKSNICNDNVKSLDGVTPPQLYQTMNNCIERNNYSQAVLFYALAGVYSWHDASAINTHYARQHHSDLVKESFLLVDEQKKEKFWSTMQSVMNESRQKMALCSAIKTIGSPSYFPNYMLKNSISYDHDQVNKDSVFELAMERYLHCK